MSVRFTNLRCFVGLHLYRPSVPHHDENGVVTYRSTCQRCGYVRIAKDPTP